MQFFLLEKIIIDIPAIRNDSSTIIFHVISKVRHLKISNGRGGEEDLISLKAFDVQSSDTNIMCRSRKYSCAYIH
jgi:uncharacterized protein (UPF0218 family)